MTPKKMDKDKKEPVGSFVKNPDGTYGYIPSPAPKLNAHLLALSYKQVEHLPDADGKQSRK